MFTLFTFSSISADVEYSRFVLFVVLHFLALTATSKCDTAGSSLQDQGVVKAPPQSVQLGNLTSRLGYDVKARNKELEDQVNEYVDRLSRLGKELKKRNSPAEIIDTFIEIAELEEDIKDSQETQDIPATLRKVLNQRQENVKELKKVAREKLLAPLSKEFDVLLHDLKQLAASGINKVYKRKVQGLKRDLRRIKHDLQQLGSSDGLNLVKRSLGKVLEDINELKTAAKDGKFAKQVRKDGKRLSSGVTYYIVRYSVWLVPKIEMSTFLDYQNIEM